MRNDSLKRFTLSLAAGLVAWLALANTAFAANEPDQLVSKAETTFRDFQNDPNMQWLRDNLSRAKAVMIAPEIRKAAFVVGGSGGRAVLLARDPTTGEWSAPAFYTIANASLGLQAGVEKSEVVMLVMTDNGLTSLLKTQAKLGGDVSIATGPVGTGAERGFTTDVVQTPAPLDPGAQRRHRRHESGCPRRYSHPGIPATACLVSCRHPQRISSSPTPRMLYA